MENQSSNFITFSEIINQANRGKMTLFFTVLLCSALAVIYNYYAVPVYRATAVIAFERFSEDKVLDLNVSGQNFLKNFVANRSKEIKTYPFAENIYRELPDSIIRSFRIPDPLPVNMNRKNYIIGEIQNGISVKIPDEGANMIAISFDSENKAIAQSVANTAISVLEQSNLNFRRREFSSLRRFIDGQIEVVKNKLQAIEDTLQFLKTESNIVSLDDESQEILKRITQAEIQYNQVRSNRRAKQKRLSIIDGKLSEEKEDVANVLTGTSSPLIIKLRERLVELEIQYANLKVQDYADDHPKLVAIKSEIERTKQELITMTLNILGTENMKGIIDPVSQLQMYLEESISLGIEIQTLQTQENQLAGVLRTYNNRLKNLTTNESTLLHLLRDRDFYNKNYVRLLEERENARLREAAEIGNIHVIARAEKPLLPERPKKKLNIIIAIFAGMFLGILIVFLKESLDEAPRSLEEIEDVLQLPVLASIPKVKTTGILTGKRFRNRSILKNDTATDPAYRNAYTFLWNSLYALSHRNLHSVMVSSAFPEEGKSTIASNIAITAAKLGKKTLLLDGDLRIPSVHEIFEIDKSPGLSNLVSEAQKIRKLSINITTPENGTENADVSSFEKVNPENKPVDRDEMFSLIDTIVQPSSIENLRILTAGDPIAEPDLFWNSPPAEEMLAYLKRTVDLLVIDTPPLLGIPEAISIAYHCDRVVLCVAAGQAGKRFLRRVQKTFNQSNHKLLGAVWNKVEAASIYGKYKYRKYYLTAG